MSIVSVNRGKIEGHTHIGDKEIPKRITNVQRAGFHGHLHVDFEDGTMRVLQKSEYEHLDLKPGDYFPPLPIAVPEVDGPVSAIEGGADAVDTQASEAPVVVGEPVVESAEGQDEAGTAPGPVDGAQEEGQQGAEVESGHAPTPEIG